MLFREYCFGRENSLSFFGKLGEFCAKLGEFAFAHKYRAQRNDYLSQKPGNRPSFRKKRSRSEKAILGALGEVRGILRAALGVQKIILGMRNPILGMVSHDWSDAKATILGATLRAIPGIGGNPHERSSFASAFSEHLFQELGWSPLARLSNSKKMKVGIGNGISHCN